MRTHWSMKILALVLSVAFLMGCSTTTKATDFNSLTTPAGKPIAHLNTSNMAIHLMLGKNPAWGDASLEKTVADFTAAAKAAGANKVRIVQSSRTNWWFVFFPISLLVTPVTSNVAGDAIE